MTKKISEPKLTSAEVKEAILEIIAEHSEVSVSEITNQTLLDHIANGNPNILDGIVKGIEARFQMEIPALELDRMETIFHIHQYVWDQVKKPVFRKS